jgi:predicted CoA-substrate-specific enzyme activase
MTLFGFDVGSRTAKCFNSETGGVNVVDSHKWREIVPSDGEFVSTGYFRKEVPNIFNLTEITSAIYGTSYILDNDADVILDIGGQDTKVIDTTTNEFRMNDRCSAGTGTFLEFMANYFDLNLEEMGRLHFRAREAAEINSTCSVFAHSEAISRLVEGYSKAEVIKGIHFAFVKKISQMIPKDTYTIALIGGAAKNPGVIDAFAKLLNKEILVPKDPQIVNAIGAVQYYIQREL